MNESGLFSINSLDYIFIVDAHYNIIYSTRYDSSLNGKSKEYKSSDIINRNLFEFFPSLTRTNSSVVQCMESGEVIVFKNHEFVDYRGRKYCTDSITIPLMQNTHIIGAVELSLDADNSVSETKLFDNAQNKIITEESNSAFCNILTEDDKLVDLIEKAKILSRMSTPILIYGETGTGKELFAQGIIKAMAIPANKRIILNCAAIPENLMESTLFGTKRGAYTGAEKTIGAFEQADGGVIFLDELNSIPFNIQAKLLRVIQEGTFRPLGSDKDKKVNVKIIAAMNINPHDAIIQNKIRSDLFFRFSTGLLTIPPLRDRPGDIKLFITHFINEYNELYNKHIMGITSELEHFLLEYSWNGNVREIKHMIEYMVSMSKDDILSTEMIPEYVQYNPKVEYIKDETLSSNLCGKEEFIDYNSIMRNFEYNIIDAALKKAKGNKSKACRILGIPRQTLVYRMQKLHITSSLYQK